jgi:DnaJ domain
MRRLLSDPIFEAAGNAPTRSCDHPGCVGGGDFRAPKSRLDLHDYHWFCLEHVRAYNSAWNYYAGMSDAEIEAEIRHDTVWQRPSWRLGDRHGPGYADRIRDPFGVFSGGPEGARERSRRNDDHGRGDHGRDPMRRALSAREQALAVFELEPPFTLVRLKARYKVLVKLHHPDAHGGDKAAEEKLKIINQAYATLKASYFA